MLLTFSFPVKAPAPFADVAVQFLLVRRAHPPTILNRFASNGGSGNVRQSFYEKSQSAIFRLLLLLYQNRLQN